MASDGLPPFTKIKQELDDFDQSILEQWKENIARDGESNFFQYVTPVDFPMDSDALIAPSEFPRSELCVVAQHADPAGSSDISISLEEMRMRFAFPAVPVSRPAVKMSRTKRRERREQRRAKGKREPGELPKSRSVTFGGRK